MTHKNTITGTNLLEMSDQDFKTVYESRREEWRVLTTYQEAEAIQKRAKELGLES